MTKEERDYIYDAIECVCVSPSESMTLEEMKSFVKGYELAQLNILDVISMAYNDMKTD